MRLALLILLLLPTAAHAGPVFAFLGTKLIATAAFTLTVGQVLFAVALGAIGAAQKRRMERKARAEYNSRLQDRTITAISTDAPLRYVLGRARVGSDVVAIFTSGSKDQYKHLVCVHAAHECDGIEEIYIAGKALGPLDADGAPTSGDYVKVSTESKFEVHSTATFTLEFEPNAGSVMVIHDYGEGQENIAFTQDPNDPKIITLTNGALSVRVSYTTQVTAPMVWVRTHLGAPGQAADSYLMSQVPGKWTADHKLAGLTYSVVTLDLNQPEFQGGIPTIEPVLRGMKLYDFRTGTTAWSQNVALGLYWYLTSDLCGVDAADLPMARWIAAANVCDQDVAGLGKRYAVNGAVMADQAQAEVIEQLCAAMGGDVEPNTWNVYAGDYTAPVLELDQSDIVGKLAVMPGPGEDEIFNTVRGQFVSSENDYVATDYVQYQSAAYLAADGEDLVLSSQDFPFTDSTQRVHNLARILTEDNREGFTLQAEFSLKAWPAKFGDRVAFDSTFLGHSAKVFRVVQRKFKPGGTVELTLKEDGPGIWDFADAVVADAIPNTNLPNPFYVAPLLNLTATSGDTALLLQPDGTVIPRIKLAWSQAETGTIVASGIIEIEWLDLRQATWQAAQAAGSDTEAYLTPVEGGRLYLIRARGWNPTLNVRGDWRYIYHVVTGKLAPPPDVASFGVTQLADATRRFVFGTDSQPADVVSGGGYRIKFREGGSTANWSAMTALHAGLLTASPYETMQPGPGTWDFAIAAVDSSGNESINAIMIDNVVLTDVSTASQAFAAAQAAQDDADAANLLLSDIASDAKLTAVEKQQIKIEWDAIAAERAGIDAQADAYGITVEKAAYGTEYSDLHTYLSPYLVSLTSSSDIVGSTFRSYFTDFYTARQALLNKIASVAGTRATWSGVVGASGKVATGSVIFNPGAINTDDIAIEAATIVTTSNPANKVVSYHTTMIDYGFGPVHEPILVTTIWGPNLPFDYEAVVTATVNVRLLRTLEDAPYYPMQKDFQLGLFKDVSVVDNLPYKSTLLDVSDADPDIHAWNARQMPLTIEETFPVLAGFTPKIQLWADGYFTKYAGTGNLCYFVTAHLNDIVVKLEVIKR